MQRPPESTHPSPYRWELLGIFWLSFFFLQADRQVYAVVMPLLKTDLGLSDIQLGLVASIFTLLYGVLSPVAGVLGDFFSKKWIVFASLVIFSTGTMLTGLSTGLLMLILFRAVATGGGEAFYYPAASAMLSQYHDKSRGQALSIHQTALYVGLVLSSWLAGILGSAYGWRPVFYVFGAGGLVAAIIVATRVRDERRDMPRAASGATPDRPRLTEVLAVVLRTPSFSLLGIAFGCMVFGGYGYMTWMPTYLHEDFHLSLGAAGLFSMLFHFVAAFLGVLFGGWISDRLASRHRRVRPLVNAVGLLLAVPFLFLLGSTSHLWLVYVALTGFGFFRGMYDSNIFAAIYDVVPLRYRSSGGGLLLAFGLSAGAAAPLALGWIKESRGLGFGLSSLGAVWLIGGLLILVALAFTFERDRQRAEAADATTSGADAST